MDISNKRVNRRSLLKGIGAAAALAPAGGLLAPHAAFAESGSSDGTSGLDSNALLDSAFMGAATISAMQSLDTSARQVFLQGGATVLDGQSGLWVWDAAATDPTNPSLPDGALTVRPASVPAGNPGRWCRWQPDGVLNAKWFGAKGNGTTDDTGALQLWLDACTAYSQPGYLPPGTYLTGDLTLRGTTNGSPRITGSGWNQTTLQAKNGTNAVLTIAPANGQASALMATIEHLTIHGNGAANFGIYLADTASRATIRQCQVMNCKGTPGAGIANENRNYSTVIDRCLVTQNQRGIQFGGQSQDLKVVNSQLFGNLVAQAALGNTSAPSNIMTLENCQIERANVGSGGDVSNIIVQNCTQLVIRSCYFESHTTAGSNDITILGGTSSNVYIDGMFSNGNRTANSSIILPADDTTVVNLTLVQPRLAGYLSDVIANTSHAKKSVTQLSQAGTLQLPVGSGPVLLDNGITFQGSGPAINATSGNIYFNYAAGAGGVILWDGQAGSGREIFRTDPVAHAVRIAGGTNIKGHLSSAGSLTFGSIAAGATAERTLTVTGAAIGDSVVVTPSGTMEAGIVWSGYVSAADTITIRLANVTGKSITPAARSFRADVWKH